MMRTGVEGDLDREVDARAEGMEVVASEVGVVGLEVETETEAVSVVREIDTAPALPAGPRWIEVEGTMAMAPLRDGQVIRVIAIAVGIGGWGEEELVAVGLGVVVTRNFDRRLRKVLSGLLGPFVQYSLFFYNFSSPFFPITVRVLEEMRETSAAFISYALDGVLRSWTWAGLRTDR